VRSLLGDAGVIDHPAADRSAPLHNRQHPQTNRGEQRLVGPVCLGHEVMQRLMRCLHAPRFNASSHRLDALAGARQQQAGAVGSEWDAAVGMTKSCAQRLDIGSQL
jgi:hypothetical protein